MNPYLQIVLAFSGGWLGAFLVTMFCVKRKGDFLKSKLSPTSRDWLVNSPDLVNKAIEEYITNEYGR